MVGLELSSPTTPFLPSPPMNSLPPRRCPTARDGVVGVVGECGGVSVLAAAGAAAGSAFPGLKQNSGSAGPGPLWAREPAAPATLLGSFAICTDRGRMVEVDAEPGVMAGESGERWGKTKSGFGRSSMGPFVEMERLWYRGMPIPLLAWAWATCCRGRAICAMVKQSRARQEEEKGNPGHGNVGVGRGGRGVDRRGG